MQKCIHYVLLVVFALFIQFASAQQIKAQSVAHSRASKANLNDLSFLEGSWCGKSKNGAYVEEYWSAPEGDSIMGHCRFIKSGKTTFYELLVIVCTPSGIVLRMRHFNNKLVPWAENEESGDCLLADCQANKEVIFANKKSAHQVKVIYKKNGASALSALVEETQKGKIERYSFEYSRANK